MLMKCALCRWLTTDQLKRLYFPQATLNAVQKRLRKLSDAGYLRSYREHPTAEALHALGPKGVPLAEERGIAATAGGEVPRQVEHLLGVNEVRMAVERNAVPVSYFFAYWQLADLGWGYPVIPDAVFAVREDGRRRTFIVEYDRGTETLPKVLEKLQSYDRGLEGFPFEAALVFTEGARQVELLAQELRRKGVLSAVLASSIEDLRGGNVFEMDFTDLLRGGRRKLLQPLEEEKRG
jgi:hypothetical protein